ncbi:MAG TPA: recombinase RecA [Mesotoga sp.]|jgi:recombination protein RecA|nr:recombinase RecA [Mesotoga sp.]NLX33224.1 recombinase RecA [Thermotogaceae bacterium]MDD4040027.1 recombinase RecA [Mesotoga sp.]MDD4478443.1 recombinase RecA [Mesotoga sp.]MDD5743152.1 recombinase RecA [Mesotoga sp.]
MISKDKKNALERAIKDIEKQFGKGSVMLMGEREDQNIEVISTGSLALDIALTVGGYPRGRVVEIYGAESSGKTTIALHAIAEVQKRGGIAAFIDAEHALDINYAKNLGVDVDNLLVSQPDYGEQALDIVDGLIRSNAVDLIVVDSVAALVPRTEIEGAMGELQVGLQARLMSQALRKISGNVNRSKCIVVFINQTRMKIGVVYGNPETTTGGVALKFYSSVRLEVRKGSAIREGTNVLGNETTIKVVKNKVAPPFREAKVDIIYGQGIEHANELFNLAADANIIERKGAWYNYITPDNAEVSIGQGKANGVEYLKNNPEVMFEIENRLRTTNNLPLLERQKEEKEEE